MHQRQLDDARGNASEGKAKASVPSTLGRDLYHFAETLLRRKAHAEARVHAEEAWTLYQQHPDWPASEREHAYQVFHAILMELNDQTALESLRRNWLAQLPEFASRIRKHAGKGNHQAQNRLAWLLATCPDAGLRDGQNAVTHAEGAVAATQRKNAAYLGTLAAAYAEAGQFDRAVSTQNEAIALLQEEELKLDFMSRLRLYQSDSPYREPQP